MNAHVIGAIFRRNFVSYFGNPTGYVFICVFVLLSSFAAFWPNEFFNANLANLDQLNRALPYILLIFVPAVTMSIWADERRQGTDELLLTIPATDFDVVIGKYLAAVGIYTVSLAFSALCNFMVLMILSSGDLDIGLFLGTYFGYWWVGLAMVALGMAASFLTGNLTVGFVLGVIFNAPLTFAAAADAIVVPSWAINLWPDLPHVLRKLSLAEQFHDFARGVVSFSSIVYFFSLAAVMLYLSMVFIGRRHWSGGRDGQTLGWHYLARFAALFVAVTAFNVFLSHHDRWRIDVTSEHLSSLSPETRKLIANLDSKRPVLVDAYISETVPESYVPTRLNLLAMLRELQALGGDKVQVAIYDQMQPFSPEAGRAEQQFGIRPQPVESRNRGVRGQEEIFLGVAVTCGLEKVVVPFFSKGIPVEYELVRSIVTASQQKRKRVGVLATDAKLYGSFDMSSMSAPRNELIVDELQKQYEVVQVDPTNPIKDRYDVLLAVQPSSLGPQQMENFVAAVAAGQPTAVFEDPFPALAPDVPGTLAPKQPPGGANPFMGRQPPQPKGDITTLWKLLGVDFMAADVIWQNYNPLPKASFITPEWVFVDKADGARNAFNEKNPVTSGLQRVLLLFPGSVTALNNTSMSFSSLMATSEDTGVVPVDKIMLKSFMGPARINPELARFEKPTNSTYTVAARIKGASKTANLPMSDKTPDADDKKADEGAEKNSAEAKQPAEAKGKPAGNAPAKTAPAKTEVVKEAKAKDAEKPKQDEISVILVSDIDCLYSAFFAVRARGDEEDDDVKWDLDNVTFVLNTLDELAGDERFLEIRKRRPVHKTLKRVSEATMKAKQRADEAQNEFNKKFEAAKQKEQKKFDDEINALRKRGAGNSQQVLTEVLTAQQLGQRRLEAKLAQEKQKFDREMKKIDREKSLEIRNVQDWYKLWAVVLPPIPPLVVAFFVFFNRRAQEREGVSKSRLR